ncbi:AAA family ATPase [Methylomicrobium lacus]|uniref:AAA family ATPase n=1 Tax=Methylomicrobium lacus TaxID=136992 RepID=UPI00045E7F99|nr:DUF3696 domain-containing protein [Methylomicrobium lacus]
MKITKISLTNFRSFKSTQSIELAPVTLLFGPNSVGKSSVLMALAYVQQILSKGHCNPQKLDALGDKMIGGFRSLVYGQDTNQSIKIRLYFDAGNTPFVSYATDVSRMADVMRIGPEIVLMKDFGGSIETGAVEFEISWSTRHKKAFVKNYRVWINGRYIGCITSSEDQKNTVINELNTKHPLLLPCDYEDWMQSHYGPENERELFDIEELHTEFELNLKNLNPNPVETAAIADIESAEEKFVNCIAPISLVCQHGAIPMLGFPVMTNLDGQDFHNSGDHLNFLVIREVLSQAFVLPLDKLLETIDKSILIGPLRVVPDNEYVPNPHPEQADWVDGSAAWDLLHKDPSSDDSIKKLLRNTSKWFYSKDKLDSGYEVINRSLIDTLHLQDDSNPAMLGLINKRHVYFRELRTDIYLSANQLGTGISQVLPLVVASNYDSLGLIGIEQPELHLHPRFQVELADLFLTTRDKHSFLIETHSEHIVLRLLRRIRESNKAKTDNNIISPDDISVVYLSPSPDGTIAERLAITMDGDFEHDWPHGFFDERDGELF